MTNPLSAQIKKNIEEIVNAFPLPDNVDVFTLDGDGRSLKERLKDTATSSQLSLLRAVREWAAEKLRDNPCHESFLEGFQNGCPNEHYNQAIVDLISCLEQAIKGTEQ